MDLNMQLHMLIDFSYQVEIEYHARYWTTGINQ